MSLHTHGRPSYRRVKPQETNSAMHGVPCLGTGGSTPSVQQSRSFSTTHSTYDRTSGVVSWDEIGYMH
ncbi:hypothetical protein CsSME_00035302 [Camellia sinensis var. sinensis]